MKEIWQSKGHFLATLISFEGRLVRIIGGLWHFHSHSCESIAGFSRMLTAVRNDKRASVSIACAISPIKKGGEVFVSYGSKTDQSRSLRQHFLREWLPEGCDCTRSTVRLIGCLGSLEIMRRGEMDTRCTQGTIVRKRFGLVLVSVLSD